MGLFGRIDKAISDAHVMGTKNRYLPIRGSKERYVETRWECSCGKHGAWSKTNTDDQARRVGQREHRPGR